MDEMLKLIGQDWRSLTANLMDLREDQVLALLNDEREHGQRATLIVRLHQRYTTLRAARERAEMLAEI